MTKDNSNLFMILFVVFLFAILLLGGTGMMGYGNWSMGSMMYGYGGILSYIYPTLFIIILILIIVLLIKQIQKK